jgi:hypothetical protein
MGSNLMTDPDIQTPATVPMTAQDADAPEQKPPVSQVEKDWKRQDRFLYWAMMITAVVLIIAKIIFTEMNERLMRSP